MYNYASENSHYLFSKYIEESWDVFNDQLKSHGYNVKDIKQKIITHHYGSYWSCKYFDYDVTFIVRSEYERWVSPTSTFLKQHDAFFCVLKWDYIIKL